MEKISDIMRSRLSILNVSNVGGNTFYEESENEAFQAFDLL